MGKRSDLSVGRTNRAIINLHEQDPFRSAVDTVKEFLASRFTVQRVLKSEGIKARSPAKKPRLQDHHTHTRVTWCKRQLRWTEEDWSTVHFKDESSFNISSSEKRSTVYTDGQINARMTI